LQTTLYNVSDLSKVFCEFHVTVYSYPYFDTVCFPFLQLLTMTVFVMAPGVRRRVVQMERHTQLLSLQTWVLKGEHTGLTPRIA